MAMMNKKKRAWGMIVESVQQDIECTSGILKSLWLFIKNCDSFSQPKHIENVFTSCCELYNILVESDGYLD
jgi:hypothetical protein